MATIPGLSNTTNIATLYPQIADTGKIFAPFVTNDIVTDNKEKVTETIWSNCSGSIITFFTSSYQNATSKNYYVDAYYENPDVYGTSSCALCGVEPEFAVAYGHRLGSGSSDLRDGVTLVGYSPSKAIYTQYRNTLLDKSKLRFELASGKTTEHIMAVNIYRARTKENLDPGNWQLTVSGTSGVTTFIDDYTNVLNGSNAQSKEFGGTVMNIVSGTIASGIYNSVAPVYYGKAYINHGILIFDADMLKDSASLTIGTGSDTAEDNHIKFLTAMSGAAVLDPTKGFHARNEQMITSTYYFVRVKNNEFNFTNNPTFVENTYDGTFKHNSMVGNPRTYITTIGLYNNSNELVAVGKLSKPILKSFEREILLRCKLSF